MMVPLLSLSIALLGPAQTTVNTPIPPPAHNAKTPGSALNPRYSPPPIQPRWGPKITIGTGVGLLVAGIAGMAFSGGCRTRDAQDRCIDPYSGSSWYPSMTVLGLGITITGGYWFRKAATPPRQVQE